MEADRWHDPASRLGSSGFWSGLTIEDRTLIISCGTIQEFAQSEYLCREWNRSGPVYLLLAGQVEVFREDVNGGRTVLAIRRPGDLIGEMSALDGVPASATARTLTPVSALVVSARRFKKLCHEQPHITLLALRSVVSRLRGSDDIRMQFRLNVRQRTILCLLKIAEERATCNVAEVSLHLTQQELADMVAASLVSVARVLEVLRSVGAVGTERGRIHVNTEKLRLLAAPNS